MVADGPTSHSNYNREVITEKQIAKMDNIKVRFRVRINRMKKIQDSPHTAIQGSVKHYGL